MTTRRKLSRGRWVLALLVAVAVHGTGLWLMWMTGSLAPLVRSGALATARSQDQEEGANRPIEIQTFVEALQSPDEKTEEERRTEEEKQREEEKAEGQVIDIARPPLEEPPEKAKFLAEYDSKVERETRGRPGRDRAGAAVESAGSQRVPKRTPTAHPGPAGTGGARFTLSPSRRPPGGNGEGGAADRLTDEGVERRPGAPGTAPPVSPGFPGVPGQERPNLQPTEEMLARAIGKGTGSPDYLRDVDEGEATALNAKKFKYASFFNRVKRAVAEEWHPDLIYVRHDPTGNVYGSKDRITVLRVHLRPDGSLHHATVMQSSGVGFLDDEAIDSFRRAQPFVNPPPLLVDADGLIHFNFGFVFELSGNTNFKVFRYQ